MKSKSLKYIIVSVVTLGTMTISLPMFTNQINNTSLQNDFNLTKKTTQNTNAKNSSKISLY